MSYFENEEIAATCGMVIDDEYILWTSWKDGSLYKLYLKDNHVETVRGVLETEFKGKTFSCMLRDNEKIFLISLFDCYEIAEYDIMNNRLRLLYQQEQKGIYIFNSFFINGKIYIFPSQLDSSICIYSIKDNTANYIKWELLFSSVGFNVKSKLLGSMDCMGNTLYGTIQDTSYLFKFQTEPQIKCEVQILKDQYKVSGINVYDNEKYITLMDDTKLICAESNGEVKEIELLHEEKTDEGSPFVCTIVNKEKIFLIPGVRNDKIQVVDKTTSERKMLEYPDEFYRKVNKCRLFWMPIIHEDKAYLFPHVGSGLLILDTCNCKIEYLTGWEKGLKNFLDAVCCSNIQKEKNEIMNIGTGIYKVL